MTTTSASIHPVATGRATPLPSLPLRRAALFPPDPSHHDKPARSKPARSKPAHHDNPVLSGPIPPVPCHVPNCPEPPERVLADGVCHKHRAAEMAAAAQADWAFWRDLEEYDPRIVIERERRERAERQARRVRALEAIAARRFDGDGTPYGVAALGGIVRDLSRVPEGGRNDALTRASFRAGGLVAGGEVDPGCAIRALREAGRAMGLPEQEVKYVVKRAFDAGMERPRSAPRRRAA